MLGLALGDAFGEAWSVKPAGFVEQALQQRRQYGAAT
jgi:hypothetical protein